MAVILVILFGVECTTHSARVGFPSAKSALPGRAVLLEAVSVFEAGRYLRAIALTDSLLEIIAPSDSQLNFLCTYYGLKSRLAAGYSIDSTTKFLNLRAALVPVGQLKELGFLVRGGLGTGGTEPESEAPAAAYRLGVVLPLSGQFYEFGEAILEGVQLAVEEFNRRGEMDRELELVVRDDGGEPVRAATLGRELASDSTVAAIIGSHGNEATLSLALVSAAQKIPLVCPTADSPELDGIGNTVHVLNRTDPRLSAAVAGVAVDLLHLHTFAVVAEDDERGELLARGFVDRVRSAGGAVVTDLRYLPEASNFENQMLLIQRYLPDAIYLTAKSDMITQLASQVHYYGMGGVQLIGGEYFDSERVIRMGGDYVDGGLFSSPFYSESEKLRWLEFKQKYENIYRRPVNRFSAYGYDAVGLVLSSLESLPANRGKLANVMRSGKSYRGATGIYSIDSDGRVDREYFVLRLASGKIIPAWVEQQADVPAESRDGQEPQDN